MTNNKIAKFFARSISALIFMLFLIPLISHADVGGSALSIKLVNPLGSVNDIPSFISAVLDGCVVILTPVVVIMFLWTGFLYIKAQGKPESITKAHDSLLYTAIGAALALGAKGFAIVISSTLSHLN